MKLTIDLSGINCRADLHMILKSHLDLPDYYGRNLDALHDCLTETSGKIDLLLLNENEVSDEMRSYVRSFKKMLADVSSEKKSISAEWR